MFRRTSPCRYWLTQSWAPPLPEKRVRQLPLPVSPPPVLCRALQESGVGHFG